MSFNISIESNLKQLQKQLSELEKQAYPKAVARTLNRVASSAKVASSKRIAPLMNTKQAEVKRSMQVEKANSKKLWASITAIGKPIKLIAFKARQVTRGIIAKVWGVNKLYRGTFIAPVRHGSSNMAAYSRKTKHSLPVKQLYGPGIAQLFKEPENIQTMQSTVLQRLANEFKHNLQYYISKIRK